MQRKRCCRHRRQQPKQQTKHQHHSLDSQCKHLPLSPLPSAANQLQFVVCHYHYAHVQHVRLSYHACTHKLCRNANVNGSNHNYSNNSCVGNVFEKFRLSVDGERAFTVYLPNCQLAVDTAMATANTMTRAFALAVNAVDNDEVDGDDVESGEVESAGDKEVESESEEVDVDKVDGGDSDDDGDHDDDGDNDDDGDSDSDSDDDDGDGDQDDVGGKGGSGGGSGGSGDGGAGDSDAVVHAVFSFSQFCKTNTFRTTATRPQRRGEGDHNRIIGNGPATTPQTINTTTAATKNNAAAVAAAAAAAAVVNSKQTELHEIGNYNNNNHIATTTATATTTNVTTNNASSTTTEKSNARTNSQNASPILGHQQQQQPQQQQHGRKAIGSAATAATATLLEKKSIRKSIFHKSQPRSTDETTTTTATTTITPTANRTPATDYLDANELQRLKYLNRHSCNGRLDFEALERHLQQTELVKQQQDKGVEAMGVLLQYLVYELDAFACPTAKSERQRARESLERTLKLLDETKGACGELQDQLGEKEAYYVQREEELQALHRCELDKVQSNLSELQTYCRDQQCAYETQLSAREAAEQRALHACQLELEQLRAQQHQQHDERQKREQQLQQRINALELVEQELLERLRCVERQYSVRENELNERVRTLAKELETLRTSKEHTERTQRELRDKLSVSRDEITVLRTTNRSISEIAPLNSSGGGGSFSELSRLQSEAESLRCVLELKQKEISKLTKQNEELLRDADERLALQAKISLLESSNELLQSELEIKSEKEKDFQRQVEDVKKAFNHELVKRTRLSFDNEALQWQLKQRSEQLHIVEAKLQEVSGGHSMHDAMNTSQSSSHNRSSLLTNGGALGANSTAIASATAAAAGTSIQVDESSPPASPFVKGIIEKSDSVSWVLEMDDETPEVAASKMVKRAGSFRSMERCPSTRRQLSLSANATLMGNGCGSGSYTNGIQNGSGPNPLSLSMSATSVIRQHSSDPTSAAECAARSHARIRSKSVSVKSNELQLPAMSASASASANATNKLDNRKMARQLSLAAGMGNSNSNNVKSPRRHELKPNCASSWMDPICPSSPYSGTAIRPRSSTLKEEESVVDTPLFGRNSKAQKLITCDTSALNSGERLGMHSLPSHPSMQEIKSCAAGGGGGGGDVMIASTNSEDEICSASSDEIGSSASGCSASATTGTASSSSPSPHNRAAAKGGAASHAQMSLDELIMIDKMSNSLSGTPMEVSWSEDGNDVL